MPQAAARATTLASALQEKARLYSGPGSFLQRNATWLSQQASADTDTDADTIQLLGVERHTLSGRPKTQYSPPVRRHRLR